MLFESLLEPNGTRFTGYMAEKKYEGWGTLRHANRQKSGGKSAGGSGSESEGSASASANGNANGNGVEGGTDAQVVWWEGDFGGHEGVGHAEGSMDLLAWVGRL